MIYRTPDSPAMDRIRQLDKERGSAVLRKTPTPNMPDFSPTEAKVQFESSSERIRQAMEKRQYDVVDRELKSVRGHSQSLHQRTGNLPMGSRYMVPSISQMYQEGADLIEEGRKSDDEAKMSLGLERLEQANRQCWWDKLGNCEVQVGEKKDKKKD